MKDINELISKDFKNLNYITFFGKESIYSNFHKCEIMYEGHKFYCSEQLFMYLKAKDYFFNKDIANQIVNLGDVFPLEYKRLGRALPGYDKYGAYWEESKDEVMYKVISIKFQQNEDMLCELISEENANAVLVEASPYDKYWGVGLKEGDSRITNPKDWKGLNRLGFLLMQLRDNLRKIEEDNE